MLWIDWCTPGSLSKRAYSHARYRSLREMQWAYDLRLPWPRWLDRFSTVTNRACVKSIFLPLYILWFGRDRVYLLHLGLPRSGKGQPCWYCGRRIDYDWTTRPFRGWTVLCLTTRNWSFYLCWTSQPGCWVESWSWTSMQLERPCIRYNCHLQQAVVNRGRDKDRT